MFTGFLGNEALFELATGTDMAAFTHNTKKLVPHRALDDAVAELIWLTKLPALSDVMFHRTPQAPCSVSLEKFRVYRDAYSRHSTFVAVQRIGTHKNCARAQTQKN